MRHSFAAVVADGLVVVVVLVVAVGLVLVVLLVVVVVVVATDAADCVPPICDNVDIYRRLSLSLSGDRVLLVPGERP